MTWQISETWNTCPAGELERMTTGLRFRHWLRVGIAAFGTAVVVAGLAWGTLHFGGLLAATPSAHSPGGDCGPAGIVPQEVCPVQAP